VAAQLLPLHHLLAEHLLLAEPVSAGAELEGRRCGELIEKRRR